MNLGTHSERHHHEEGMGASEVDTADELTCAICLGQPAPVDIAVLKGCEHLYCVNCILHWALYKETPLCPQCKSPFNYLFVHRMLDGTVSDYAIEESVCLLKRATWFQEHVKVLEKGKAVSSREAALHASDWQEAEVPDAYYYDDYVDDEDEDEQIEQYYFSSAAGSARITLGNRRFGENGYVRGGRVYARPVPQQTPPSTGKGKGKGKSAAAAASPATGPASGAAASSSRSIPIPSSSGASGSRAGAAPAAGAPASGSVGSAGLMGTSPTGSVTLGGKPGRRAKRAAKRAAADAGDLADAYLDGY
eukprot:CAMPEP_0202893988 /NCGR_PEP_ID=MMETSP1392-20130828/3459_1 /ASSEMBLY_ACC=CAM_ASM_000868 /TAXON_ID=225041 /ORGANISM="Chlamydomonas chlamydogama, Strain SAG 11-48b" /LENGTH=305 /DNA_ID=CAMNT_0049578513 /DNA_START=381 /DNA_END=1298 /DNA_ORIENTATION=-